jgi:hypothetical protein
MEVINMIKNREDDEKITKRVRFFLSWDPLMVIEGSVSIPGSKTRLSDVMNDDRPFISIQDVVVLGSWIHQLPKFLLLNKREAKGIIEVESV